MCDLQYLQSSKLYLLEIKIIFENILYSDGNRFRGIYNDTYYENGVISTGTREYDNHLYQDGILSQGTVEHAGRLYQDGTPYTGFGEDGITCYVNGYVKCTITNNCDNNNPKVENNTITFKVTTIASIAIITVPERIFLLYIFIICETKSLPPVDAFAFSMMAVPIPTSIPPYRHARILSFVNVPIF